MAHITVCALESHHRVCETMRTFVFVCEWAFLMQKCGFGGSNNHIKCADTNRNDDDGIFGGENVCMQLAWMNCFFCVWVCVLYIYTEIFSTIQSFGILPSMLECLNFAFNDSLLFVFSIFVFSSVSKFGSVVVLCKNRSKLCACFVAVHSVSFILMPSNIWISHMKATTTIEEVKKCCACFAMFTMWDVCIFSLIESRIVMCVGRKKIVNHEICIQFFQWLKQQFDNFHMKFIHSA